MNIEEVTSEQTAETRSDSQPRRPMRLRRLAALCTVAGALIAGSLTMSTGVAGAYARGCTFWNRTVIKGIPIGSGQFCSQVNNPGRASDIVDFARGDFVSATSVCNWDISAEFFDGNWKWKKTYRSARHTNCSRTGSWNANLNTRLNKVTGTNTGYMCSTLRSGGVRVTSACQYIHK